MPRIEHLLQKRLHKRATQEMESLVGCDKKAQRKKYEGIVCISCSVTIVPGCCTCVQVDGDLCWMKEGALAHRS